MLSALSGCLSNYVHSKYESDKGIYRGWSIKGRVISLINIPPQIARGALFTTGFLALALFNLGSAGLRITFKAIPFKLMSHLPATNTDYWKHHAVHHSNLAIKNLLRFEQYFCIDTPNMILTQTGYVFADVLGCTIAPNIGRRERLKSVAFAESVNSFFKRNYFHYKMGINNGSDPIPVSIPSLGLPPYLDQPMYDIVNEINRVLANATPNTMNRMRTFSFDPTQFHHDLKGAEPTEVQARQARLLQYMKRAPGDKDDRPASFDINQTIMAICLGTLIRANAVHYVGYRKEADSYIIEA